MTDEGEPTSADDREKHAGKHYVTQAPVPSKKPPDEGQAERDEPAAGAAGSDTGQPDEQAVGRSHPEGDERETSSGAGSGRRTHPFRDETGSEEGVRKPPARH